MLALTQPKEASTVPYVLMAKQQMEKERETLLIV